MKRRIAWSMGAVAWVFATLGLAAEPSVPRSSVMLDAVVVTAEKIDAKQLTGDVDPTLSPVMTTTIQRESFEGKTESLAEVIEKEVGVQIRQSGGLGSFSSVSLRGSSSDQVLVFMDGILLNDAAGGGVDLGGIALSDVAAIDIYRGAVPIHFGDAGIGGAINIRTLRAEKELQGSLAGGYGSFDSRTVNAFFNHKPGRFDYLVSADYLASDNDYEILNDGGTKWNPADDRIETRNNAQVEQANLLVKAGYDASDSLRLDLMNQFFTKDQGLPSWNNSALTRTTLETDRNILTLKMTADDLSAAHLNTTTRLSYTWKEETYDDREGQIGLGSQYEIYTTKRYLADTFVEWAGDWQQVIATVNLMHETYAQDDLLGRSNPGESRRDTVALGLQDSIFLLDDALIVVPALRYNWIEDTLGPGTTFWGGTQEEQRRRDDYFTPQIGLRYGPAQWLTLRTNLAEYVRQPSFFELFGDRGLFVGNPDLKEERGRNFDIGAEGRWTQPFDWLQRLSLAAAFFYTDAQDLITRVYDSRGIGRSVNISDAVIQGVEVSAAAEFLDRFRAVVNLTHQDPENRSQIAVFDGKRLPGRYENAFLGRLEGRFGAYTVYGEYVAETGTYYDTANLLPAEDKNEINAGISWSRGPWLLRLDARNLTDERIEDFNGFPLPGRSVFASVKYTFATRY